MVKFLPNNVQTKVCEPALASALEEVDWCAAAKANNCYSSVEEDGLEMEDNGQVQEALENIIANQQIIYSYLQESFDNTNQSIANLQNNSYVESVVEEPVIDEKEQQRLQLQAQIEALQNEMASL